MKLELDFYSIQDLMKLLGKSERTIRRWISSGRFPHAGIHGLWSRDAVAAGLSIGNASKKELNALAR